VWFVLAVCAYCLRLPLGGFARIITNTLVMAVRYARAMSCWTHECCVSDGPAAD